LWNRCLSNNGLIQFLWKTDVSRNRGHTGILNGGSEFVYVAKATNNPADNEHYSLISIRKHKIARPIYGIHRHAGLDNITRSALALRAGISLRFLAQLEGGEGNIAYLRLRRVAQALGTAGTIGARAVAKAAPDGYTLMVGHSGLFAMAPGLYGSAAGFDPRKDFAPIGGIASYQQVLVVNPSLPVRTLADLLALARKEPGSITYATAGIGSGSHVSTELFTAMANVKLTHVPYRGSGPAVSDLVGGHVAMGITTIPPAISQIRSGLLRAIAVTGDTRLAILPDLPTIAESGVPGYVAVIHYSMVAPAGTPRAIVERLNTELRAALNQADVRARIADEGGDVLVGTPESLAADIDQEETKWGALVRKLGLRAE
jgi:tripartite-type tricarboxylate transporter receptor subunit TctC